MKAYCRIFLVLPYLLVSIFALNEAGAGEFKRPATSPVLRQNEDWSGLAGHDRRQTGDLFDPVKYVPLSKDGSFWMSFGGQIRFRLENWHNFGFSKDNDDTFLLTRVRLHADLHAGEHFRLFVEGKSALSTDRSLPGGRRTLDVDELDLQQTFFDASLPIDPDTKLTLRAGRQILLFGKQRLVSPLDWSNTMRTWDGANLLLGVGDWRINGFWSQFVPVKKYDFNEPDSDEPFAGLYATGKVGDTSVGLDMYWLYRERKGLDERRHTLGGRISGAFFGKRLDYDVEGSYQLGDMDGNDIRTFMIGSQAGYKFMDAAGKPRLFLGFDFGSGDSDPEDGTTETFDQLYPLGHAYLGYIDVVGRQNIIDQNMGISFTPAEKLTVYLAGHFFWRHRAEDALYNVGGGVARPGDPGTSLEVGQEVDLLFSYAYNRHLLLTLGYSHFFPGEFIKETGPDDAIDFLYAGIQLTF